MYKKPCLACRITPKIPYILRAVLGKGWECIFKRVSRFVSITLNVNGLGDAYRVYRRYRVLLKINRIFWLLLIIIFANYFLTIFNNFEKR